MQTHKEVPTLTEFWPRFMEGYARANRQKPSGIETKELIGRVHLLPQFGALTLDAITPERVQQLKHRLVHRAPKTVNNVLTVLSVLLKKAVEWQAIDRLPCVIRLLPITRPAMPFHDFADFERLVETARSQDRETYLIVLLGGEAGLRCGEIAALEWQDIDFRKRQMCVRRSVWRTHVTVPKGGRHRYIPLTVRLAAALRDARHLRGPRVLAQADATSFTPKMVADHVRRAARRATVLHHGVHVLRHTFCSHLAMRGAPARAIQELAGHKDLSTTQRYMHLSPAALKQAIRLLSGDIVETTFASADKSPC